MGAKVLPENAKILSNFEVDLCSELACQHHRDMINDAKKNNAFLHGKKIIDRHLADPNGRLVAH